jgi:hypothetical protein
MGGFVIDIVVAYLIKCTIRVFYFFQSSGWERTKATLTDCSVIDPDLGCPSVAMQYEFLSNGQMIQGSEEIPFYMRWHAKTYRESLSRGLHPIIRVNPKNPQETRFFERDQ